jgi:hypothetical protein
MRVLASVAYVASDAMTSKHDRPPVDYGPKPADVDLRDASLRTIAGEAVAAQFNRFADIAAIGLFSADLLRLTCSRVENASSRKEMPVRRF